MAADKNVYQHRAKKPKIGLIPSMFLFTSISMVLTELAGVISTIIDGMITSRMLGEDAYSAVSLLGPFVSIVLLVANFFSMGNQIVCSQHVGKGEKEEAKEVFSVSFFIIVIAAAAMVALCALMPRTIISLSGVSMNRKPELYPLMDRYIYGYLFGIPAVMMVQLISPVIVLDGSMKLLPISSGVLCAANIIGDITSVRLFHAGIFGIGLSTSIAYYVQMLVLITHFFRKNGTFRLVMRPSRILRLIDVAKAGYPSLFRKIISVLRDLIINRFNLIVALSTAAVAAKGMQNDLNLLVFCLSTGISRALLMMCGVYYSAEDKKGLTTLFSFAMKFGAAVSVAVGAVLALAAPMIAHYYAHNPEVISLAVFSLRCLALSMFFDMVCICIQHYLQGIQQRKILNVMSAGERFIIPVSSALLLGHLFGSKGILASSVAGKILLVACLFLFICIRCKGIPRRWEDFMFLPKGFGGSEFDNMYERMNTMEDVAPVSEKAQAFCADHGINERGAKLIALMTEEAGSLVMLHGKKKRFHPYGLDYHLAVNDEKISITFRDFYAAFDPVKWREIHNDPESQETVGIDLVMRLAENVKYFNAFQSNNLIIYLSREKANGKTAS